MVGRVNKLGDVLMMKVTIMMIVWQGRQREGSKETYYSVKRDLL
jgi:hypothetical protein